MDLTGITMTALTHPLHMILVAVVVRPAIALLLSGRSLGSTFRLKLRLARV